MAHFHQMMNKLRRETSGEAGDQTLEHLSDDEGRRKHKALHDPLADDWSDSSGDFNQADFDVSDEPERGPRISKDRAKLHREEVEHHTWPPTTHSTSRGVFYVTPNTHAQYDPRFKTGAKNSRSAPKEVPQQWVAENSLFEPTYLGESTSNISKRMDAYARSWNECLFRCSKVVEIHFEGAILELSRFVRSEHEERYWNLNIIPTAVVVMGVDTSDHPMFYGVLESRLRHNTHAVAVLRPADCRTMSSLMKSLVRQILNGLRSDSEYSYQSILNYAKSLEHFSMTIVVENVEQWSFNHVLSDFLMMTSRFSSHLSITLILAVSSTSNSVSYILPHSTMQLLMSRTFQLAPSSSAVDMILKETILSDSCPFRVSEPVLKWLLETIKFLNHSVSSIVTKIKLIYWRFFSTRSLSWVPVDFRTVMYGKDWVEISEPFSRRLHHFLHKFPAMDSQYPDLTQLVVKTAAASPFPTEPLGVNDAVESAEAILNDAQLDALKIISQFSRWTKMFKSSQMLRSFALTLFIIAKHMVPFSPNGSTGLHNAFDFILAIKGHQRLLTSIDKSFSTSKKASKESSLKRNAGLAHANLEDLQDHSWDGCPQALEYLALLTRPADCVRTSMAYLSQNPKSLLLVLQHWQDAAASLESRPEYDLLHQLFFKLFGEALGPLEQITDQHAENPSESFEPEVHEFLDRLHHKMEEFVINSFVPDIDPDPVSEDLVFDDVAFLIKRCNPNIQVSQATQTLALIADLEAHQHAK